MSYPNQQQGHPPYGQAPPGPYQQPPPGQYQTPPPGQYQQPPSGYPYQQPPPGQYSSPPPGQYNAPPPGQYQQPPPGQYQQQPPPGQYQSQPGQYQQPPNQYQQGPGQYQQPPPGQYQQPGPHGQQQQPPNQYGQPPAPYPPQQWPAQQYPGQPAGVPPQQPYGQPGYGQPQTAYAPPTPASPGYDPAQKQYYKPVDTSRDVEVIRGAMKGFGCDKKALIKVFTDSKYANPWAMEQLVTDYNKRLMRDLVEDIKKETSGGLEDTLLALIRGPLANDVRAIHKAIEGAGTDKAALADVLLGRSNADIRAITEAYRRQRGKDLLKDIKDDIRDDKMCRIYSMVLAASRQEPGAPVNPQEIDAKVTELMRATEGIVGANEIAVAEILVNANAQQLAAMNELYQRKFHRKLEDVIEDEFRGSMEDAFLHMLAQGADQAKADAEWLRSALVRRMGSKDKYFIYRLTTMYWERSRLDAAKAAYQRQFGHKLKVDVLEALEGSYEDVVMALIGEGKR